MNCRDHAFKWRINGYSSCSPGWRGWEGKLSPYPHHSHCHTLVPFSYSGTEQSDSAYLPGSDKIGAFTLVCIALPNLSSFLLPLSQAESTIFLGISAFQLLLLFSDVCLDLSVFLFLISWFCFFHSVSPLSDPLFCLLNLFICFNLCFCPIDYCSVSFCLSLRSLFFSVSYTVCPFLSFLSFCFFWPPVFLNVLTSPIYYFLSVFCWNISLNLCLPQCPCWFPLTHHLFSSPSYWYLWCLSLTFHGLFHSIEVFLRSTSSAETADLSWGGKGVLIEYLDYTKC